MTRIRLSAVAEFALQLNQERVCFIPEYRFDTTRRWRLDFYLTAVNVGVEIEGAVFTGGRHVTGRGFTADCEKYNAALLAGIPVARFTTSQVRRGEAIAWVREYVARVALIASSEPRHET